MRKTLTWGNISILTVLRPEAAAQPRVQVIDARVQDSDDHTSACDSPGVELVDAGQLVEGAGVELFLCGCCM